MAVCVWQNPPDDGGLGGILIGYGVLRFIAEFAREPKTTFSVCLRIFDGSIAVAADDCGRSRAVVVGV